MIHASCMVRRHYCFVGCYNICRRRMADKKDNEVTVSLSDVVLTTYGVGVIVGLQDDSVSVRLWRVPGKSVGSAAKATLQKKSIVSKLPVAPGMVTKRANETKRHSVLVLAYYDDRKTYLTKEVHEKTEESEINNERYQRRRDSAAILAGDGSVEYSEVSIEDIQPSKTAKFYPILEALMLRGDQATEVAESVISNPVTQRIFKQTEEVVRSGALNLKERSDNMAGTDELDVVAVVKSKAPEADEKIKEVLKIVKDEELTSLLGKCQSRLEQMVQSEIPQATQTLLAKGGIQLKTTSDGAMVKPRQAALDAVKELLSTVEGVATEEEKAEISKKFSATFESLNAAAQSDRNLQEIFETFSEKTADWQKMSGQLMQTRSAGLFMEGASRIQARVGTILHQNQSILDTVGSQWTKAFTEGDTALAKLKSIELGTAVKTRLVNAIEVRSDSAGGLDGIIAGALSTIQGNSGTGDIKTILSDLQGKASSASEEAQETFISVLSKRSLYQDVALLHIEEVLGNLDEKLGDGLSPDALASVVQGQGGTALLFQPIAERAVQEIDSQLSVAEGQVTDKTVLEVLKKIRKLASGELSLSSLMEEAVSLLNNDDVVAAGETLVQHGEVFLDAIEGVSGNKVVNDAMQIAEKAGISKDSVMKEVEKIDVNSFLDTAGSAVSDEKARMKLLSSATDTALDFVLRILPSMPVPPFEGVKDGLIYNIADLSLEGFKVRKEDIHIELAGMTATSSASDSTGYDSADMVQIKNAQRAVKATELLIVDIKNVSAILENAAWGFEQTYLPYLKGSGTADVAMSNGRIRLQFELRKLKKDSVWEPVLCLHDRTCTIGEVEMKLQGEGRLTWILNKLATVFKGPLRDYVVRTIVRVLTNQSGWILSRLNHILSSYWELILRTAKLQMEELVEVDESVVVEQSGAAVHTTFELVWRDRLPLGMNLLTNDESGYLKVVDFPRGSQARSVCERRQLDPEVFKGARIIGVNGTEFENQDDLFDALVEAGRPKTVMFQLANPDEAKSVADFVKPPESDDIPVAETKFEFSTRTTEFDQSGDLGIEFNTTADGFALEVSTFFEGDGGIVGAAERSGVIRRGEVLTHVNDAVAVGFDSNEAGQIRAVALLAEAASTRPIRLTFTDRYLQTISILRDGDHDLGGPSELVLRQHRRLVDGSLRVTVKSLVPVSGVAESSGILIGDHLVFVNGIPVGAGARWLGETSAAPTFEGVMDMLQDRSFYPIGLTFARARRKDSRWDGGSSSSSSHQFNDTEADTFCVTAESFAQLGCVFRSPGQQQEVVVTDFRAVPGCLSKQLENAAACERNSSDNDCNTSRPLDLLRPLSVERINGELVPSYASVHMVQSALSRCWKKEDKNGDPFELELCDDEQRASIRACLDNDV